MKILVIGAGGHGKVCCDTIRSMKKYEIIGFIDDNSKLKGKRIYDLPVLGNISDLEKGFDNEIKGIFIAIGNNEVRERIFNQFKEKYQIINAIDKNAIISESVKIGKGVLIVAGAIINADSKISDGVIINTGATIDHDCILEKFAFIAPGAHVAGGVTIGSLSEIGIGSSIIQNKSIGKNTIIGAGSVVVKDIPANCVAYGVPAEIKRENKK